MKEFSKEGHCKSTDSRLFHHLANTLKLEQSSKFAKHEAIGISWGKGRFWYIKYRGTSQEYQLQELLDIINNKPMEVKQESLVGRWFKALVNYDAESAGVIKGNYYQITREKSGFDMYDFYFNTEKIKGMGLSKKYTQNYELMPPDFNPNEVKSLIKTDWKVGDAFEVTENRPNCSNLVTNKVYYVYSVGDVSVTTSLTKGGKLEPVCGVSFEFMKPVEVKPKELAKEELLKIAKEKYPVGCTVDQRTAYDKQESRKALPHEIPSNEKLPEKWCVCPKTADNLKILIKYFKNFHNYEITWEDNSYSCDGKYATHLEEHIKQGYTEITFDQFKRLVLKESITNNPCEEILIEKHTETWEIKPFFPYYPQNYEESSLTFAPANEDKQTNSIVLWTPPKGTEEIKQFVPLTIKQIKKTILCQK